jgi:hypothetical protein
MQKNYKIKLKEKNRKYYLKNRDKVLKKMKKYKKIYKEKIKQYQIEYREKNKDKIKKQRKKYYQRNKKEILKKQKKHREKNKKRRNTYRIKKKYNINNKQYINMLKIQNRCCAICYNKETIINKHTGKIKALSIDHDHKAGKVRGLLCSKCNKMLGTVNENIFILKNAIDYLNKNYKDEEGYII